jgi:hypothetical protein
MGWQDEAAEIREGALAMLNRHGEWLAPAAHAQSPVRMRKATVGDLQMMLHMREHPAPTDAKPYRLQIWSKGRQVAHMEWSTDGGPLDCRTFASGEWRQDLAAFRR